MYIAEERFMYKSMNTYVATGDYGMESLCINKYLTNL